MYLMPLKGKPDEEKWFSYLILSRIKQENIALYLQT